MAKKIQKWTPEELKSFIDTLASNTSAHKSVSEHNKIWKKNRTLQGCERKFEREGLGTVKSFLKFESKQETTSSDNVSKLIKLVKTKNRNTTELCNELDMSPNNLAKLIEYAQHKGYNIKPLSNDYIHLDLGVPKVTEIRHVKVDSIKRTFKIAVCGDIHKGSLHARHEEFKDFVNYAHKQGCKDVFVAGDILAGINMFPGQNKELVSWSGEEQVRIASETIPKIKGVTYRIIGGNHDESFVKASGLDALVQLCQEREDIIHYGYYHALLNINGVVMEMCHPDKAGAYAITYHMQKAIESTPGGMKPQLAFYGHTHQAVFLPFYRGVAAFYVGCFEDQSLYLKRKHIQPVVGGWIVEIGVTASNEIRSIKPTYVHYLHGTRYECNPSTTEKKVKMSENVIKR